MASCCINATPPHHLIRPYFMSLPGGCGQHSRIPHPRDQVGRLPSSGQLSPHGTSTWHQTGRLPSPLPGSKWAFHFTLTWQQMGFSFYPHLVQNGIFILPSLGTKWAFHFTLTWHKLGFSFYLHLTPNGLFILPSPGTKWNFHFTLTWHKLGFSFYLHLAPNGLFILSSLGTKWALHFTLTCTRWGHLSSQAPEWMFTCTAALLNLNVVLC